MRKLIFLLPAALMLAACPAPGDVNSAGSNAAPTYGYAGEYRMIPAPKRLWETPLDIAKHFVGNHPESREGKPGLETRLTKQSDGRMVMHITAMGYLDDSVRGEQWRLVINPTGNGWGVVTAENRFMCQRGANEGQWVIQPCP